MLATTCHAQSIQLEAFAAKDEWTFRQESSYSGKASASNEIQFGIISKNKNGDSILGFVRAITDTEQVIWQPLGPIPSGICLRDFVGSTNLNLPTSCKDGLTVGQEWESSSNDSGGTEKIKFRVVGQESIEVSAGKFNVWRIRGIGKRWNADKSHEVVIASYWFAPTVRAMARASREYRSADGKTFSVITEELVAAKVN